MGALRTIIKVAAEKVLSRGAILAAARRMKRGQTLIVAWHNIVPAGMKPVGELGLHLPQEAFGRQLDELARVFDVVALDAIMSPAAGSRPRAVITFDDAYLGALTAGVDELERRRLPATMFVAPGLLGGQPTWWDELADPMTGTLPESFRDSALRVHGGRGEPVRAAAAAAGLASRELPGFARTATEAQLLDATRRCAMVLGSHTWSHPNLAALTGNELETELARPLEWLSRSQAPVTRWLAYPYGLATLETARAAKAAGYTGALLVAGGWAEAAPTDPFLMPRFNVSPGLSIDGFRLRTAGLGPFR